MEMGRGIVKEFERKVLILKSSGIISFLFCDDDEVLEVFWEKKQKKSKMLRLLLSQISKKNTQYFCPLLYFLSLLFAQNLQMRLMALDENLKSTFHFPCNIGTH